MATNLWVTDYVTGDVWPYVTVYELIESRTSGFMINSGGKAKLLRVAAGRRFFTSEDDLKAYLREFAANGLAAAQHLADTYTKATGGGDLLAQVRGETAWKVVPAAPLPPKPPGDKK